MASIQSMTVLFAIVQLIIFLGFGIAALLVRSTAVASICEAVAHGGLGIGGILYLYVVVPRFKALFMDFGTELPELTMILISLSDLAVNYWYILLFGVFTGVALDVLAFATFHRVPESRYVARIFSAIVTCGILTFTLFAGLLIASAQTALIQAL